MKSIFKKLLFTIKHTYSAHLTQAHHK